MSSSAGGAFIAFTLMIALLAGCSGGSVSTTPVGPAISGTASSTLSVATAGGYAPLPAIAGMTGTVLVPPAIGASAPVPVNVTVSSSQPAGVPAPPVSKTLAYVSFVPTGAMNVPWFPQFNATFAAGAVPAGAQVVWYYYRLGGTTTQSHRQFARARRGEWLTEREMLAQSATTTTTAASYEAPAAAGSAGSAGVAGLSVGTIAAIGAGVVAVAAVAQAVASPSSCGSACAPVIVPGSLSVAAGATTAVSVTSSAATSYSAALQDCANAAGGVASAASIATLSAITATVTAGTAASFSITGIAAGTCAVSVSGSNGSDSSISTTSTLIVGAGAPIQGANASSFATPLPNPSVTPTATPTASPSPSPSPTPTASPAPSPTPAPTLVPTNSAGTAATTSVVTVNAGTFPIPGIAGVDASSAIAYPASTGANGQQLFVTASTSTNFAGLPSISGKTPVLYLTASYSSSNYADRIAFGSGTGLNVTVSGSIFTAGVTYYISETLNGSAIPTNPVVAVANGADGEVVVPTPFSNITLAPDDIVGIQFAR